VHLAFAANKVKKNTRKCLCVKKSASDVSGASHGNGNVRMERCHASIFPRSEILMMHVIALADAHQGHVGHPYEVHANQADTDPGVSGMRKILHKNVPRHGMLLLIRFLCDFRQFA
jgi:hypothetical protein